MAKKRKDGAENGPPPVMSLKIDSRSSEPQDVPAETQEGFQTPCTLHGVMAGLSGGSLGYLFGFGGYWMRQRTKGQWKPSLAEGWSSAKARSRAWHARPSGERMPVDRGATRSLRPRALARMPHRHLRAAAPLLCLQTFAIMGGIYAAVGCFMRRLRQKEDAWNGAASGCATGLVLGWSGGPAGALQSCALLGMFSYFVDGLSSDAGTAHASALPPRACPSGGGGGAGEGSRGSRGGEGAGGGGERSTRRRQQLQQEQEQQRAGQHGWLPPGLLQQLGGGGGRSPLDALLSPAVPLLAALAPCRGRTGAPGGCAVARRA
eukprot:scaffold2.g7042.t1